MGGTDIDINEQEVGSLARWNGKQWSSLGGGVDGSVFAIAGDSNGASRPLTIGGNFRAAGATISHNIAVLPDSLCCLGDVDQSGMVNVQDLLAVIGAWGGCGNPNHCPADIAPPGPPQGDEMVNVADLLAVINQWGPCS